MGIPENQLLWKSHLPNLFEEILKNEGTKTLRIPLKTTFGLLQDVARRANEINDPELNHLMVTETSWSN